MRPRHQPKRGTPESTSRSLLIGIRQQDPQAWDRLVFLYAPLVVQWCRHLNLREHEIPDVVQEVFQVVATKLDQFRKQRNSDSFRGWLRTVTRNKVIDYLRCKERETTAVGGTEANSRITAIPAEEPSTSPEEPIESDLLHRALSLIQEHFAENTWRSFWLTVVDGRPTADVADELGMRPGTVRVARSRVLNRLRMELGEIDDDQSPE